MERRGSPKEVGKQLMEQREGMGRGSPPGVARGSVGPGAAAYQTILIVDDEPDILETLSSFLERSLPTVRVRTATSGANGLVILARERVHLIIADYRLPAMDGLEFLKRAGEVAPRVPRLLVTGILDSALEARAKKEVGVERFLAKPFDLERLLATVAQALGTAG